MFLRLFVFCLFGASIHVYRLVHVLLYEHFVLWFLCHLIVLKQPTTLDTLQRRVQWIGGAVDGGSII